MLWDLYQEMSIRSLRGQQGAADDTAEVRSRQAKEQVFDLEDRFDRLLLLTDALWELASTALGLTDEQLAAKVAEIDAADGAADGRRIRPARPCSQCRAAIPRTRATCMFCGHHEPGTDPFDAV